MFIHLRTHSAYSLLEGAIKVKDVVKLAKAHNMPAVAITDTNNMFGALEFALEAVENGIQPIMGCQLRVIDKTIKGFDKISDASLLLFAQNETGYSNLTQLVSAAYLDTPEDIAPHITLSKLEKYSEGIIVLTGGVNGPVGQLLLTGQAASADELIQRLKKAFPTRLYVELQRHKEGEIGEKEERLEGHFLDLAYKYELPIVATNDVQFAIEEMSEAHDALLCIAAKRYVSDGDRLRVTTNHYFKTAEEMEDLFDDLPEAIANSVVIAQRCAFWPKKHKPILPPFKTASGLDEVGELKRQAEEGLQKRFDKYKTITDYDTYRARLAFELDVITRMGFAGYFLIVADFIQWAKANNIPVGPGRGSGVGSLVAWALTITDLDPLPFGLLFERFLNPERISMPDFDIDFCQERRDEVIGYVQQRYGADKVAQIITFGKLQARAVLRNVGRVLGMPLGYVDKICKLVPFNPANPCTLKEAIQLEPQLKTLRDEDASVTQLMDISIKLEGLYAHASTHAAGLVIGDRPLQELVPMYRDPRSPLPVTQFNMKTVEQAGLVKFDFLGLKTLDVLQLAEKMARAQGADVDLAALPLDDAKTYELFSRGDTLGVFQLESAGMRDTLRRMKPNRFEDIIALVALYRPGPMDNIPKYIEVKAGKEKPDYLHPLLEPVLKETYGIAIYQEQVMQIAQVLAGYTLGSADLLRRAMGKKIKEEMAAQRKTFVDGAVERGVDADQASMIFDQVDKFAGYGFNKSHAAAYALIAYQTAYMKANYPVAFYAASMTFEMGAVDKLNVFRQELNRKSIPLLPPDVNFSDDVFALEDIGEGKQGIRYALAAIKGVGQAAMKMLAAERRDKGKFKDMFEFSSRLDNRVMNKRQMENLINAGAFDSLHRNRAQLIEHVEMFTRLASAAGYERESGQVSMFGAVENTSKPQMQDVKPWDELVKLQNEFSALGFFLSSHPLDAYRPLLDRLGAIRASGLAAAAGASGSTRRKIAGIVISKQERTAKSGNRFAFVQLSDNSGMFEATLFSETLSLHRDALVAGTPLLLSVDVQGKPDEYRLTVQGLEKLEMVAARESQGLALVLGMDRAIAPLQTIAAKLPKGKSRIQIKIDIDGEEEAEIELSGRYTIPPDIRNEIKALQGVLEVQDL
ncbi:MAG: DNA polymerase III subunit alpha [Alphaproteobacteria bacterium]|nr:DNA polymerase III subunit alpha [Alphaproteobacteria bacterium]